jgi:hypothetical protein
MEDWGCRKARHERPKPQEPRRDQVGMGVGPSADPKRRDPAIGELAAGTAAGVGSDLAVQGFEQAAERAAKGVHGGQNRDGDACGD